SPTRRRAHSSTRWPSGVKPRNRDPRSTKAVPRDRSRLFTEEENVGWLTPAASAARPKWRSSARSSSNSSWSSIGAHLSADHWLWHDVLVTSSHPPQDRPSPTGSLRRRQPLRPVRRLGSTVARPSSVGYGVPRAHRSGGLTAVKNWGNSHRTALVA